MTEAAPSCAWSRSWHGSKLSGDRSLGQVARDFDLTETAVRAWAKQAELDAATPSSPANQPPQPSPHRHPRPLATLTSTERQVATLAGQELSTKDDGPATSNPTT